MYRSKHFQLQELVHPDIFNERGERAWELLSPALLQSLDQLRAKFGPVIINTWHSQKLTDKYGRRVDSGMRKHDASIGAKWSAHKFGLAADCLFADVTVTYVRKYVIDHPDEFPFISAIEDGVSWFHFDCRNCTPIKVFKP